MRRRNTEDLCCSGSVTSDHLSGPSETGTRKIDGRPSISGDMDGLLSLGLVVDTILVGNLVVLAIASALSALARHPPISESEPLCTWRSPPRAAQAGGVLQQGQAVGERRDREIVSASRPRQRG